MMCATKEEPSVLGDYVNPIDLADQGLGRIYARQPTFNMTPEHALKFLYQIPGLLTG